MKKIIIIGTIGLLAMPVVQAQGTVYISNLNEASTDSLAVGSDSWYAAFFETGPDANGYLLDSIALQMTDATGNPDDFTVMIYGNITPPTAVRPGSSLATLNGSDNPSTAGIYTYTPDSSLILSPSSLYFVVLTDGTTSANGAYEWSATDTSNYNPTDGWSGSSAYVYTSSNGSSWTPVSATYPQFVITATPIPEPSNLALLGLGTLLFISHRNKSKLDLKNS